MLIGQVGHHLLVRTGYRLQACKLRGLAALDRVGAMFINGVLVERPERSVA